jgi:hypothetical protein
LFHPELDLHKLKESLGGLGTSSPENCLPLKLFIGGLVKKKGKCEFKEYIDEMREFFSREEEAELVMEVLSEGGQEIAQKVVKEILEETLGREISDKEFTSIMLKIF